MYHISITSGISVHLCHKVIDDIFPDNIEMETGTSVIVPLERNIIMIEGYQDGVNDAVTKFVNILEKMVRTSNCSCMIISRS